MTPDEKQKLDNHFKDLTKYEVEFLREHEAEKNESGVYLYTSKNGYSIINLDLFLRSYRDWLVEHRIVKEMNE